MPVNLQQSRSRRALLAGLAGAAGVAAAAAARPGPARAGVDGDVVLGAANTETATTAISNTSTGVTAVEASAADAGVGLVANSAAGSGVHGHSGPSAPAPAPPADPIGVFGQAEADLGTGVWGRGAQTATSNSAGVIGEGDVGVIGSAAVIGVLGETFASGVGVYGSASDSVTPSVLLGAGVTGQSDAKSGVLGFTGTTAPALAAYTGLYGVGLAGGTAGRGVYGYAPTGTGMQGQSASGTGVKAISTSNTGFALRVQGKAGFTRSGKIVVTAGHSNVVKTSIALTSSSFVIATLQTNVAGLFIQAVVTNVAGSKFTIYLNKAPAVSVAVAWLVVN